MVCVAGFFSLSVPDAFLGCVGFVAAFFSLPESDAFLGYGTFMTFLLHLLWRLIISISSI